MTINRTLTAKILTFLIVFYLPIAQACDRNSNVEFEELLTIFNGPNDAAGDTEIYDFSVNNCEKMDNHKTSMNAGENTTNVKLASKPRKKLGV